MNPIAIDLRFLPENIRKSTLALKGRQQNVYNDLIGKRCKGAEFTGWFDLPKNFGFKLADSIKTSLKTIDVDYDAVLVIGIGGSYLGVRAVCAALGEEYTQLPAKTLPVFFAGQHLSSRSLAQLLTLLETYKPMVNVISKSGTTTEPAIAFRVIRAALEKRFGSQEANKRIIATTDPVGGALRKLAKAKSWLSFEVPGDVGGRYSVLTAVGQVPLALAGYDVTGLLEGADQEFASLKAMGVDHPAVQYAGARYACLEAGKAIELLSYCEPTLNYTAEWWKQLFGESEGKEGKGLFPASLAFTTDLHSLGQIVQEGQRNIFETFLSFSRSRPGLLVPELGDNSDELQYLEGTPIDDVNDTAFTATKMAHYDGGVPCIGLNAGELSAHSLGQLFAFFETSCALTAGLMGVNAFDQPGVEAYKKNLFALLGKPGFESLRKSLESRI